MKPQACSNSANLCARIDTLHPRPSALPPTCQIEYLIKPQSRLLWDSASSLSFWSAQRQLRRKGSIFLLVAQIVEPHVEDFCLIPFLIAFLPGNHSRIPASLLPLAPATCPLLRFPLVDGFRATFWHSSFVSGWLPADWQSTGHRRGHGHSSYCECLLVLLTRRAVKDLELLV